MSENLCEGPTFVPNKAKSDLNPTLAVSQHCIAIASCPSVCLTLVYRGHTVTLRYLENDHTNNKLLLKNYQSFFSLHITSPLESTSSLTSSTTSWSASSWFISSPRSSHLMSVIITTLIIHHPIILLFQPWNLSFSQILPSIDIWHPFADWSHGYADSFTVFSSFQFFSSFGLACTGLCCKQVFDEIVYYECNGYDKKNCPLRNGKRYL